MKRWLAAAVTLIVFGAAGLAVAFWPEHAERSARPVSALGQASDERSFDTLEIVATGASTTLTREGRGEAAGFTASANGERWPADGISARAAFTALEQLDWVARVTARGARHAELQVDDAQAVRVRVRRGDRLLTELLVGKVASGGTFVRLAGDDQVWRVGGELRGTFEKSPTEWRDPHVTKFDPDQVRELAVIAPDGARIVVRRRLDQMGSVHAGVPGFGGLSHARWELVDSSVPIDRLDEQIPTEVVSTLSALDASGFADGLSPAATGLDPGALTVRVELSGAGVRAVTVAIGKDTGADETFVKVLGAAQVFRIKRFIAGRINRRPIQFRDKTLCNISDQDLVAFGVKRAGGSYAADRRADGWRATRSSGARLDPEGVRPLASAFRAWTAPAIAEDGRERASGRPQMVITGRSKDQSCTISAWASGADYLVRTANSSDVYVVPKVMVDRMAGPISATR